MAGLPVGLSLVIALPILSVAIVVATGGIIFYHVYKRRLVLRDAEARRANILKHGFGIAPPVVNTDAHRPSVHGWGHLQSQDDLLNMHPALREPSPIAMPPAVKTNIDHEHREPPWRHSGRKPRLPSKSPLRPSLSSAGSGVKKPHSRIRRSLSDTLAAKFDRHQRPRLSPIMSNRTSGNFSQTVMPPQLEMPKLYVEDIELSTLHASGSFKTKDNHDQQPAITGTPDSGKAAHEFQQRNPELGLGIRVRDHAWAAQNSSIVDDTSLQPCPAAAVGTIDLEKTVDVLHHRQASDARQSYASGSIGSAANARLQTAEPMSMRRISGQHDGDDSDIRLLDTPKRRAYETSGQGSPGERYRSMTGHLSNTYRRSDVKLVKDDDLYSSTSSRAMSVNNFKPKKLQTCIRVSSQPTFLGAQTYELHSPAYIPKLGDPPEVLRPDGEYHRPSSLTPSSPTLSMTPDLGDDTVAGAEGYTENFPERQMSIGHISIQGYRSPGRSTVGNNSMTSLQFNDSRTALISKPSRAALPRVQPSITELRERSPNVKSPEGSPQLSSKGLRTPSRTRRSQLVGDKDEGGLKRPSTPLDPHISHASTPRSNYTIRPVRTTPLSTKVEPVPSDPVYLPSRNPEEEIPRTQINSKSARDLLEDIKRLRRMNSEKLPHIDRSSHDMFYQMDQKENQVILADMSNSSSPRMSAERDFDESNILPGLSAGHR